MFTLDYHASPQRWCMQSCDSLHEAVKTAMRRLRGQQGRARIYKDNCLVWQRGK